MPRDRHTGGVPAQSIELCLRDARRLVDHGFLGPAEQLLRVAQAELNACGKGDVEEVLLDVLELRAIVARDSFWFEPSLGYLDHALAIATAHGDRPRQARLSLAKATTACVMQWPDGASGWLQDGLAALSKLNPNKYGDLYVEAYARLARIAEQRSQLEIAKRLYDEYVVPRSREVEPPGLLCARKIAVVTAEIARRGMPTGRSEVLLTEAEEHWRESPSLLREMQWRVALASFLSTSGDLDSAEREANTVRSLMALGNLRNNGAERLLRSFCLDPPESTMPPHGASAVATAPYSVFLAYVGQAAGDVLIQQGTYESHQVLDRQVDHNDRTDIERGGSMRGPDKPPRQAGPNILNAHTISGSQIQQGTVDSTQTIMSAADDLSGVIAEIRRLAPSWGLGQETEAKLMGQLDTAEELLKSDQPHSKLLRESLTSTRAILEGAAGSALVVVAPALPGLVDRLAHILATLPV